MIKIVKNNNKNYPGASTIFIYLTLKAAFGFDLWHWNLLKTILSKKSKKFLFERISLAIQRGNAASIRGTFPDSAILSEIFVL
jgi:hypothetical protein